MSSTTVSFDRPSAARDAGVGDARDRRRCRRERPHLGELRAAGAGTRSPSSCRSGRGRSPARRASCSANLRIGRSAHAPGPTRSARRCTMRVDSIHASVVDGHRRLERRRDRRDARADLVGVVRVLVPRVDRHEVTLARAAQPQPVDRSAPRRSPSSSTTYATPSARATPSTVIRCPSAAASSVDARGRRHVAERAPQRRHRRVAMQVRVGERALHPARARERDQSGLGLGVTVHGGLVGRTNRTREPPKGCTRRDGSTPGISSRRRRWFVIAASLAGARPRRGRRRYGIRTRACGPRRPCRCASTCRCAAPRPSCPRARRRRRAGATARRARRPCRSRSATTAPSAS